MIRLGLRENKTAFRPGETIAGAVLWEFAKPPASAEVRLVWFTRGKGTEDGGIAATDAREIMLPRIEQPKATPLRVGQT